MLIIIRSLNQNLNLEKRQQTPILPANKFDSRLRHLSHLLMTGAHISPISHNNTT